MSKILEIKNLNKDFGTLNILNNINVAIEEGDFLVLVGPSGCGKSTLLNCIAGLEPISGGSIAIDGRDMTTISPKDRDIAMVFQSYALYPTMTVGQNITYLLGLDHMSLSLSLSVVFWLHKLFCFWWRRRENDEYHLRNCNFNAER